MRGLRLTQANTPSPKLWSRPGDWADELLEHLRAPLFDTLLQPDDVRACLLYGTRRKPVV